MEKNHWVMDYETLSNCFLGVFEHYKKDIVHVFTIGVLRNDLVKFLEFLDGNRENNEWHVSFNGISFDSQITQYVMANRRMLLKLDGESAARRIYAEAQDAIDRSNRRDFPKYSEKKLWIKQIDLFKLNHWDNPAKNASLKWIQCSMDWHNVQDMPIHHTEEINTLDRLRQVASYGRNDVSSTKAILHRNKGEIALRANLTDTYKINLYSASEPKISKELFLFFLSKKIGVPAYQLKQYRTFRSQIIVKDIILPYTKFDVPEFKNLLYKFQNLVIDAQNLRGAFTYKVDYRGVQTDFGLGGVHGAKRGVFVSDEHMIIMSSDVKSYYPNLAIRNGWSPAHLPSDDFCELYEWFYDERQLIPKSDPRNYVYKIILNSTYGLSNDKFSFLYDPEFTMRITINGQLSLMMLYTMLVERIPGAVPLMQNTDGVEIMIPRKYQKLYMEICQEWELITKQVLEHDAYQKLILPDVNNYIGVFEDKELSRDEWLKAQAKNPENLFSQKNGKFYMAKTKCKGRFEFKDRPLHKNKSFSVISKAIYNYFVYGLDPKSYIHSNKNIFDFCGQVKARGAWNFKEVYVENQVLKEKNVQKTLRYYVSEKGNKIFKVNENDGRRINVESGRWEQVQFNRYKDMPFDQYGLDYRFYLSKAQKEIKVLEPDAFSTQMKLQF